MQGELELKAKEVTGVKDEMQKVLEENKTYKAKFEEQSAELEELKKVKQETQDEFEAFKSDMMTKNSLIT